MRYILDTNIIVSAGRSLDFQAFLHQEFDHLDGVFFKVHYLDTEKLLNS